VHPSPHGLRAAYGVKTTASGKLDVRVGATRTTVTVKGEVPKKVGNYTAEFSHPDPVGLFSSVLMAKLGEAGITVDGGVRRARDVPAGTVLASLRSPVADALGPINAESRNGVADQLFLALGGTVAGAATRDGGHEATGMALARLGVPSEGLVQVDGSGLSRDNRVSAEQITALLAAVLGGDPRSARPFRESLAVMGESGTLDDRLVGEPAAGRVSAKTGWFAGASALSGVARTADGRELVFSILVEYPSKAGGLNT
jgi:D-alanyl-D-alanine carboxypeptidase/D-alanyl-D-alanine-endopeptidase (penicillin-binding protein 4)